MDIVGTVQAQHRYFESGATLSPAFRLRQLGRLERALAKNEKALLKALQQDLGKAPFEGYSTELMIVREELAFAAKHLRQWMAPRRVPTSILHFPSRSQVLAQPLGVALIISPWNYPLQLTLNPLIAAISAGCCAVVKPSRYASRTALLLEEMLSEIFPPSYVAVFQGGAAVNTQLLEQPFDKIFFTGSPRVGQVVMEAAARQLTPVTLELGGKSPCIVDGTAPVQVSARRIAFGKFTNAGQTCVAPDYVLVPRQQMPALVEALEREICSMYGADPLASPDLPHIINQKHFDRLSALMESGRILYGGQRDAASLAIAPTLLGDVAPEDPIMQEEIFGPLLPIIPYDTEQEARRFVLAGQRPLALYLFSRDKGAQRRWMQEVPFGGGCVNDTLIHLANPQLPFGGIGQSGMGTYHGRYGFEAFTHYKGIVEKSLALDLRVRYAPYGNKLSLLKKLTK